MQRVASVIKDRPAFMKESFNAFLLKTILQRKERKELWQTQTGFNHRKVENELFQESLEVTIDNS